MTLPTISPSPAFTQGRDHCGQQHGGTVEQEKQNEARQLRRTLNLFNNPDRKAELFAMRACCSVCNKAAEV